MARACIFCGTTNKLSGEHILPNWLSKMFDKSIVGINEVRGDNLNRSWTKAIFQEKLRKVCEACNHGWMSKLESDAKNMLSILIFTHEQVELVESQQQILSLWAQKTLLVISEATGSAFKIPTSFYSNLYTLKRPLNNILVNMGWKTTLGGTKPTNDPLMSFEIKQVPNAIVDKKEAEKLKQEVKDEKIIWAATLSIGYLVFQFFGHDLNGQLEIGTSVDNIFLTINPYEQNQSWPSTYPIEMVGGLSVIRSGMY